MEMNGRIYICSPKLEITVYLYMLNANYTSSMSRVSNDQFSVRLILISLYFIILIIKEASYC